MKGTVSIFKWLSVISAIVAILVTLGAIGVAAFLAFMLGSSIAEAIVAIWQSLSLGKYFFNAFLVILSFFTLSSMTVKEHYVVFLLPAVLMAAWNLMTFPHLLAYFYCGFWVLYSVFLALNRKQFLSETAGNCREAADVESSGDSVKQVV